MSNLFDAFIICKMEKKGKKGYVGKVSHRYMFNIVRSSLDLDGGSEGMHLYIHTLTHTPYIDASYIYVHVYIYIYIPIYICAYMDR
jgi:hypothetical protein